MPKSDPHQLKDKLTKRYIEAGRTPQDASKAAEKQAAGYDRRRGGK